MSVAEILEEVEKMSSQERREQFAALRDAAQQDRQCEQQNGENRL